MSILLLNLLILVPVVGYWRARQRSARYLFFISGASFGAVVAPLGLGLYAWFYISPLGVVPGIFGLVLTLVHEPPGFQLAVFFGFVHAREVVTSLTQQATVEAINAIVWSTCYGLLGLLLDRILAHKGRTVHSELQ